MLIFDNNSRPILLDSIFVPTLTDHFWALDLNIKDFTLTPLTMLEEIVCSTVVIRVEEFDFAVPANWNILIFDEETSQLDVVEIHNMSGKQFSAFVFGPNMSNVRPAKVSLLNYLPEHKNVAPSLNKHLLLCHPIGPDAWINIGPNDSYNKYLKDMTIGDLF
jgi:hypothetical protein